MKLYINTSDRDKIVIDLDGHKFETQAKKEKSQKLLPFIIEALKGKGYSLDQIKEIEVNTGPGSFTGLRVGVSVANALGWSLDVPVNGKKVLQGKTMAIHY